MSKYLCADCVLKKQCDGEWTTNCVSYVPKEHKQTNEEWFCGLSTEEKARFLAKKCGDISCKFFLGEAEEIFSGYWVEWLKKPHTIKEWRNE